VPAVNPGVLPVKLPESVQVVLPSLALQAPKVTTYVPRPAAFGPVPAMVRFCALRPRSTVTGAAFAIKAVDSIPRKQKAVCEMDFIRGVIVGSARFRFLILAFIDMSLP
jgi:hypothetical protein